MRRLNIYFMHSTKFDYNNLLYKEILSSAVCLNHNLILPMSKEFKEVYRKDLITKADIIIIELSNPTIGLGLELKWLKKENKPKLFLSLNNEIPKQYKKYITNFKVTSKNTYLNKIEDFILEHANDVKEIGDNSIYLGDL